MRVSVPSLYILYTHFTSAFQILYMPPSVYTVFYFNFYENATMCSKTTTCKLNLLIGEIIDEVISNWDGESSKLTIESFRCKINCLVIIKIRRLSEKHHFLKSAISIKPSNLCDLMKLQTLLANFQTYCSN